MSSGTDFVMSPFRGGPSAARAVFYMMIAGFAATFGNATIRFVTPDLHPFEITFFRAFLSLFVLAPMFFRAGIGSPRTKHFPFHVLRGAMQAIGMLVSHWAVAISPMAKVTALSFTGPLFATLLATLFMGERFHLRRMLALIFGFAGAVVIVQPGVIDFDLGAGLALIGAFEFAITMTIVKVMARTESSLTLTLYLGLVATPLTGIAAYFVWVTPTLVHLGWMFIFAACATVSNLAAAHAVREADMAVVMPIRFTRLIFAALIGYFLFQEIPDTYTWIGGMMIFSASMYIAFRERNVKQETAAVPAKVSEKG